MSLTQTNDIRPTVFAESLYEKLTREVHIDPNDLAELFRLSMQGGPLQIVLQQTIRNWLLSRTIAHAVERVPYYRERAAVYQEVARRCGPLPVPSFAQLPLLRRNDLKTNAVGLLADHADVELVCHTSGSTGTPISINRSSPEVRFVQRYYNQLLEPLRRELGPKPLTLSFPNFYHGSALPLPSIGMPLISGVTDDTLIQDAAKILLRQHNIPGCSERVQFISGLSHHVIFFTNYLLEKGIDVANLKLSGVSVTGGQISPHWTEFLQRAWNCPLIDRWSMTELIGGATRDHSTGLFVFDPHILVEVVDPNTGALVEGPGVGELVVTTLYPFVQMQPLIRYATGDLVYQTALESTGFPAYAFLGKVGNCISDVQNGSYRLLVSSAQVYDMLTSWPEIFCYDFFSNVTSVRDRLIGSMPIFELVGTTQSPSCTKCRIVAQLRFNPDAFPGRRTQLKEQLTLRLATAPYASLGNAMETGIAQLQVELVGPGSIVKSPAIKV